MASQQQLEDDAAQAYIAWWKASNSLFRNRGANQQAFEEAEERAFIAGYLEGRKDG